MLSENWLEACLQQDEAAQTIESQLQQPTQEELVMREMVLLGAMTEEEAQAILNPRDPV